MGGGGTSLLSNLIVFGAAIWNPIPLPGRFHLPLVVLGVLFQSLWRR